jgi:hypothetical protein
MNMASKLGDVIRDMLDKRKVRVTLEPVEGDESGRAMWKYVTPDGKTLFSDNREDLVGIAVLYEMRQRRKMGKVM